MAGIKGKLWRSARRQLQSCGASLATPPPALPRCGERSRGAVAVQRFFATGLTKHGAAAVDSSGDRGRNNSGNRDLPLQVAPGSNKVAEAERGDFAGDGPQLEVGPILADFLAMGAGQTAAFGATPSSSGATTARNEAETRGGVEKLQTSNTEDVADGSEENTDRTFRGRPHVVAALQPSEPIIPEISEAPPRVPLSRGELPLRSVREVPPLFADGFLNYVGSLDEPPPSRRQTGDENLERSRGASPQRDLQLRVQPWHRMELCKIVCRSLFALFLQDIRAALGLSGNLAVLWRWERRRAQEHADEGQVVWLLKYLVETEFHMKHGPERSTRHPGSRLTRAGAQRIRAERRRLVRQWGLGARDLEEDAVIRVFLDGCASWREVRALLGDVNTFPSPAWEDPAKGAADG